MAHVEDRWMVRDPEAMRLDPKTKKKVRGPRWGKGNRWLAVWHEPDGTRRKRACTTKDAAVAHLEDVGVDQRAGTYVSPERGRMTMREWSVIWLAAQTHLKPSGRARVIGIIDGHVLPRWGAVPLADITSEDVQGWVNELAGAPATVHRVHGVLARMLDGAVRARRIATNEAREVNRPARSAREHRYLTVAELDALLEHAGEWAPVTRCLALTAMRIGEVAELRVRDVDLARRRVKVSRSQTTLAGTRVTGTPKTKAGTRSVPLPGDVVADMTGLVKGRGRDDLIYMTPQGAQLRRDNYRRAFLRAAAQAGLTGVRAHDLRHTAVSLAVASGASVKVVQRMVGHASAAITLDVYAGLFDQDLDDVTARMDAMLERSRARSEPPQSPQTPAKGV